jgi:hypothetical protein
VQNLTGDTQSVSIIADYGGCIVLWPNRMNANLSLAITKKLSLYRSRSFATRHQSLLATASYKKSRNIEFILAGRILRGSGT